jgi:hypothetical protein
MGSPKIEKISVLGFHDGTDFRGFSNEVDTFFVEGGEEARAGDGIREVIVAAVAGGNTPEGE